MRIMILIVQCKCHHHNRAMVSIVQYLQLRPIAFHMALDIKPLFTQVTLDHFGYKVLTFPQNNIPRFRNKICCEIVHKQVL